MAAYFFEIEMLKTAQLVGHRLAQEIGQAAYYNLENIVYAVEAYTVIDKVIYIKYDVSNTNPIWGQFWKYSNAPKSYASAETIVEIRYASHLETNWRRFVVCKELCHALESDSGTHSVSPRSIDKILSGFSLSSASKPIPRSFPAFEAEALAELGALEMLCPVAVRKDVIQSDNPLNLCQRFGIPDEYSFLAFDQDMIEMIETIFRVSSEST